VRLEERLQRLQAIGVLRLYELVLLHYHHVLVELADLLSPLLHNGLPQASSYTATHALSLSLYSLLLRGQRAYLVHLYSLERQKGDDPLHEEIHGLDQELVIEGLLLTGREP
jgi:hypothetical protein